MRPAKKPNSERIWRCAPALPVCGRHVGVTPPQFRRSIRHPQPPLSTPREQRADARNLSCRVLRSELRSGWCETRAGPFDTSSPWQCPPAATGRAPFKRRTCQTACDTYPPHFCRLSLCAFVNDAASRAQVDVESGLLVRYRPTNYFRSSGCRCARSLPLAQPPSTHPSLDVCMCPSPLPSGFLDAASRAPNPPTCFSARRNRKGYVAVAAARACARCARRACIFF